LTYQHARKNSWEKFGNVVKSFYLYIHNQILKQMKKILLTINFTHNESKFWWDCGIKNKTFDFDPEKQTIHDLIKEVCSDEGMELSYKGKPQGNVYRDLKDGGVETVGYMYRGKGEVYDRNMPKPVMVFWDIWVTVSTVEKFEFEQILN
jgi:hypothetical protein